MQEPDRRILERTAAVVRGNRVRRHIVLSTIAAIVLLNTITDVLTAYSPLTDDIARFRTWAVISLGLTSDINPVLISSSGC